MQTSLLQTLQEEKDCFDSMAFMTIDPQVQEYARTKSKEVQETINLILEIDGVTR